MTDVTIAPAQAAETPEAQAALLARADKGTEVQQPAAKPGEQLILGKYKTQADLENAYKELERKFHAQNQTKPATETQTPAKPATETPDPNAAKPNDGLTVEKQTEVKSVLETAGVDFDALQKEYTADGKLSEASFEKLQKAGFPKAVVDQYLVGVKATADTIIAKAHEAVGGKETFDKMRSWAAANLSDAELSAYNDAAKSGGESYSLALAGLKARFESSVGREPNLLGGGPNLGPVDSFGSWQEVTVAMKDARYGKDPAYTKAVQDKMGRSKL